MLNSLAYLGFSCISDIEDMTLNEYTLRMEAYQLQKVEKQEELALQAWLNRAVKATKGRGKNQSYYYKNFKQLYDAQKNKDEIRSQFEPGYISLNKQAQEAERKKIMWHRLKEFYDRKGKINGTEI